MTVFLSLQSLFSPPPHLVRYRVRALVPLAVQPDSAAFPSTFTKSRAARRL